MLKEGMDLIDAHFKNEGVSRRDAMKMFGAGGAAMLMGSGVATEATAGSSAVKAKILTLVGAGIWDPSDVTYQRDDFVPSGVTLIKEKAVEFDPENNTVKTSGGKTLKYDYMVIAAGLSLDYGRIQGLGLEGTITSRGDDSAVRKVIGKNGITSIYFANGAADTWTEMQKFIADAKSGKKVKGIFTHPNTPIKCGGAPKKIMYLTDARLREAGARDMRS